MSRIEIQLDDDVFDESFLKELDQLEEFATSSTQHHRLNHPQPPLLKPSSLPPPLQQPPRHFFPSPSAAAVIENINYSPPRQLSQRFTINNNSNNNNSIVKSSSSISTCSSRSPVMPPNPEIDFLKCELNRVSKQLSDLKDECSVLRKERDKKEQQLNVVHSNPKTGSCDAEALVPPMIGISRGCENLNAIAGHDLIRAKTEQKSTGIQTDKDDESASTSISGAASSSSGLPKLIAIWSSRNSHSLPKKFVAKLLETCASDFCALFGYLGLNMTSKTVKECLTDESLPANVKAPRSTKVTGVKECLTDKSLPANVETPRSTELTGVKECLTDESLPQNVEAPRSTKVTGVSQLYLVLNKLSNDIVHINAFVDILLDLCKHENALVVYSSLRILRVAVGYLLTERTRSRRDNIKVKGCHSGSDAERIHDSEMGKSGIKCDISGEDASILRFASACNNISNADNESVTRIDWLHLFTSFCQTAVRMTEEHVKVEAVSIMNIILRGMNPYSERGQFGERCDYKAVAALLKRDAGFFCQKEAVHLVYLLLNCPNTLATFCSSCKDTKGHIQSANDGVGNFTYQTSCAILDAFADCILCPGHSLKELSLCRNALVVMAFLASSGKSGLDIFLYYKLNKRGNFLGLILNVLVLEIDAEALDSRPAHEISQESNEIREVTEALDSRPVPEISQDREVTEALDSRPAPEISQERTLLIREALILLNRLVSHPTYATSVLQVLTSCRDIVSLAIDCATRLSKRSQRLPNCDFITKQMRESEMVDLASIFRKRIFTFLKEST